MTLKVSNVRKIKLPKDTVVTIDLINDLLEVHMKERSRIKKLKKYYDNDNEIMRRQKADPKKPNNKLSHNYAAYITDNYVGYMVGIPITYKSNNIELVDKINHTFVYNDEVDHNTSLAQDQSICGYAYEMLYTDEQGDIRFAHVDTEDMIVCYDNTLEASELFALRIIQNNEDITEVELIDAAKRVTYLGANGKVEAVKADTEVEHNLGFVPICSYENNNRRIGDFEKVITLIDAYDQASSDTANDFEYFTDALLVISGQLIPSSDEEGNPLNFKDNRVLNFTTNEGDAKYLIKQINDTALENYKSRLNKDIHKFSNVIDLSDENFAANLSGVAIKFKLTGMENKTAIKANKFRKGLMRRIEIIVKYLGVADLIKGTEDFDLYADITPVFTRNIPSNAKELADIAKSLYGILSDETIFGMIPQVENPQEELEKVKKQKEEAAESFGDYDFNNEEEGLEDEGNNN